MAKTMADHAEKMAIEKQIKIAIAIMDSHGNLKYFRRMDGNNYISVRMSQLKASTSASMPMATKVLGSRNKDMDIAAYMNVPDVVILEGGLPIITKDGQHIGSIGISGANRELDGICAQAGLDAVAEYL